MNMDDTVIEKPSPPSMLRRVLKRLLMLIVVLFLLMSLLLLIFNQSSLLLEAPFHLLCGWLLYLFEVIPRTQLNVELLLCSLGALALGIVGLQLLMSRFFVAGRWPWRFTLAWCGMLIVMFSTSIAAVGIVHQTGWLFRLPHWIDMRGMSVQVMGMSHAKQVVWAARQYARVHDGRFPDTCADMMPEIVTDSRIFWVSVDRGMPLEPLVYVGAGVRDSDAGNFLVVWSPRPSANGMRIVGRLDGSAEIVREEKFQEMLAEFREISSHAMRLPESRLGVFCAREHRHHSATPPQRFFSAKTSAAFHSLRSVR